VNIAKTKKVDVECEGNERKQKIKIFFDILKLQNPTT
jgi:predicted transcriptional regulator